MKELYSPTYAMLSQMFGVTYVAVRKYFKNHKIPYTAYSFGGDVRKKEKWETFCNGVIGGEQKMKKDEVECAPIPTATMVNSEPEMPKSGIQRINVFFRGINSWEELYDLLKNLPIMENASIDISVMSPPY